RLSKMDRDVTRCALRRFNLVRMRLVTVLLRFDEYAAGFRVDDAVDRSLPNHATVDQHLCADRFDLNPQRDNLRLCILQELLGSLAFTRRRLTRWLEHRVREVLGRVAVVFTLEVALAESSGDLVVVIG